MGKDEEGNHEAKLGDLESKKVPFSKTVPGDVFFSSAGEGT